MLAGMLTDRAPLRRVVAIANSKGGVGKTSLSTTLAGMAAAAGYKILLVDLDPQGNAGEDLGYTGRGEGDDGAGLVAAIAAGTPLAVTIAGVRENVDVICGGDRLDDLAGLLLSRHRRGDEVADVLAGPLSVLLADKDYDLVLIDCPPGESTLQMLALGAARWLVVPTRGDAASLKGMARIAQRLVQARTHNPNAELLGVVLFDIASTATRLRREIQEQITNALGGVAPLFDATIRHSVAATDARGRGLLVHEHAAELEGNEPFWQALREGKRPVSAGSAPALAGDYAALAHEILLRIATIEDAREEATV
jgi:cellulose biosynthesis protein BcsQ